MAYCKRNCGRSQVLFVGPDLKTPKYRKVCVFDENDAPPPEKINFEEAKDNHDILIRHGAIPPQATCKNCNKTYKEHEQGYDMDGWLEDGFNLVELPQDWPYWNPSSNTWTTKH